jgi:carbonic anhydrase
MSPFEILYRYSDDGVLAQPPEDGLVAWRRLDEGNRAFARRLDNSDRDEGLRRQVIRGDYRDLSLHQRSDARIQRPFAAILGCSDARVPTELIFSEGINDLFVVRVAGNGMSSEVLGSLKYAIEHLAPTLRLIAVLGHSGCGAMSTAVDIFLSPANYLNLAVNHSLRSILDHLLIVVHASARKLDEVFGPDVVNCLGYREALVELAVVIHAALAAHTIEQEMQAGGSYALRTVYGVYRLDTHEVWGPRLESTEWIGLARPPTESIGFSQLGNAVAKSDRIASLLHRATSP